MGRGRGPRLRPNPGMPEKAPGASSSLREWRLPTDSFSVRTDQAARGPGARLHSHSNSLQEACRLQEGWPPSATPRTEGREDSCPLLLPPWCPSQCRRGRNLRVRTQTQARWQPSRPNKGSFPLLTVETQRFLFIPF